MEKDELHKKNGKKLLTRKGNKKKKNTKQLNKRQLFRKKKNQFYNYYTITTHSNKQS